MLAHAANILRNKLDGIARTVSVDEFRDKIGANDDFIVLDVRKDKELEKYKPRGAQLLHIPLHELIARVQEVPKGKTVFCYCAVGTRSYEAQRILNGAGINDVYFIEGGMNAWIKFLDFGADKI